MASILDKYGIKEVADVTFYELDSNGMPTHPVLYLDTLKVSTIEQTAENTEARGGKGNPALVSWDYGKEITVTLEDALFSAKSMAIMFGNGSTKALATDAAHSAAPALMRTEEFVATGSALPTEGSDGSGWKAKFEDNNGKLHTKLNPKFYDEKGVEVTETLTSGARYFCTFDLATKDAAVIEISGDSFPKTYYVTGDTYARSAASGEDEFFQFIIPKAKMNAENTITLEAEGDPSVFNMSLRVLRPDDGVMMKLVKYNLTDGDATQEGATSAIYHNHVLTTNNMPAAQG